MRTWVGCGGTVTAMAWWIAVVTDCVVILSSSSCSKEIACSFILLFLKLLVPSASTKKEDNIETYVEETGYVNVHYIQQGRVGSLEHKMLCVIFPSELSLTSEKVCAVRSCYVFFILIELCNDLWGLRKAKTILLMKISTVACLMGGKHVDFALIQCPVCSILNLWICVWDSRLVNQPGCEADLSSSSRAACMNWTYT
jgi:hypothetical protein